jgi:hypothetical protein
MVGSVETTGKHAHYLRDLGRLLRDDAAKAREASKSAPAENLDFERGQLTAYVSVLSLMQQQAVAFDLPLSDLSLEGLDPERDLLAS